MVLPGFTAEESLRKANFDYYSVYASGNVVRVNQILFFQFLTRLPDGPRCRPRCGPCENGVQECVTRDCDIVELPCPRCRPYCDPCINFFRKCRLRDCSVYYQPCCPCTERCFCRYNWLICRRCDCSEYVDVDNSWGCQFGPL
jgi:hypothetical protein